MPADAPLGLVLAGGRAARLGGGDKALRIVGGRTVLSRIADRLAPQCVDLALSANGAGARFAGWPGVILPDEGAFSGHGPLAGILAGLDWAARNRPDVEAVMTVPGDTPFLPVDLGIRLAAARAPASTAFARSGGRDHPLAALWPIALRDRLRHALAEGRRRVRDLHADGAAVDWPCDPLDPFFNINTPEDMAEAERLALAPRA